MPPIRTAAPWIDAGQENRKAALRLICFAGSGGSGSLTFRGWGSLLGPWVEVCPVELPGHWRRSAEPLLTSSTGVMEALLPALRPLIAEKPFAVFGFSMGSVLAFDLVRCLRRSEMPMPTHLIVGGRCAPNFPPIHGSQLLHTLPDAPMLAQLQKFYGALPGVGGLQQDELLQALLPALRADLQILETYQCLEEPAFDLPLSVFAGDSDISTPQAGLEAWQEFARAPISVQRLPGGHYYIDDSQQAFLQQLRQIIEPAAARDAAAIEALPKRTTIARKPPSSRPQSPAGKAQPLAIVGVSCRFSGVRDLPALWALLRQGRCAIDKIPPWRWRLEDYYDANPEVAGKMNTQWGGFIEDVDQFDAPLFGMSPREARSMDPQQRLLLTLAWEAWENAGIAPQERNVRTGVYLGVSNTHDYDLLKMRHGQGSRTLSRYDGVGDSIGCGAGKLSQVFDLQGPALAIDASEASSLAALHLACQGIWNGDCERALVGSAHLMLAPQSLVRLAKRRVLARDQHCRPFDTAGTGYVPAEGAGVLIVVPLAQALSRGNKVLGVIDASALIHCDVRTPEAMQAGWEDVMRTALANAELTPDALGYLEADAAGSPERDAAEVAAISAVFGGEPTRAAPLQVASVKGNLGHTGAASGLAGLLKALLMLQHRQTLGTANLQQALPALQAQQGLAFPTQPAVWEAPMCVGISAHGVSGAMAHVIIEAPPPLAAPPEDDAPAPPAHVLMMSARTPEALIELAGRYATCVEHVNEAELTAVCAAAAQRAPLAQRLAVPGKDRQELLSALTAVSHGEPPESVTQGRVAQSDVVPRVVFLFAGQGGQYCGMGRDLYETQPLFRQAFQQCAKIADRFIERPLLDLIYDIPADETRLEPTSHSAPALFSIDYALAALWREWGLEPHAVMGHSFGEYVAACVAGTFDVETGLRLVMERGRIMDKHCAGAMQAVFGDEASVARIIAPFAPDVALTANNSAKSVVIGGLAPAVAKAAEELARHDIASRKLRISAAGHCFIVDPILDAYEDFARQFAFAPASMPIISNVTGNYVPVGSVLDATYWRNHTRQPVQFSASIKTAQEDGCSVFVEVGPHATLSSMLSGTVPDTIGVFPSMRRQLPAWSTLLSTAGALYTRNVPLQWKAILGAHPGSSVALPTYPFDTTRYWFDDTTL